LSSVVESPVVQVSGTGVVSAMGLGKADTLIALDRGSRNPASTSRFKTSISHPVFEVSDLPPLPEASVSRTVHLLLVALEEALQDSGLRDPGNLRVGACFGTTVASQLNDIDFYRRYREDGSAPMDSVHKFLQANLSHFIARRYGLTGPVNTIVNACSSGADAIGVGLSWLRHGLCDIVLAGGADEMNLVPLSGFSSLGIVSPEPCRPFDRDRRGLNLGEGAGVLVLENRASATRRNIKPKAWLCGYGAAADAHHLTAPHPEGRGLKTSILRALEEARVELRDVGFVNAHGTATPDNDLVEGRVLLEMFGKHLPFGSTKGYTGHTLGAAGGIEAVLTVLALQEGWIPGNAGFTNEDERIGVSPITERTRVSSRYGLSTSLAFGGNNAALLFCAP